METREEILERLRRSSQETARYANAYRALARRDFDSVYPLVMGYIRSRFLLTRERCPNDRLLDMADASLRYMLELKRRGIDPGEISRSCAGASSVISKKVLLMKAVQEDFQVSMTPGEFADISTAAELAAFLCAAGGAAVETAPRSSAPAQVPAFDAGALRADFPALAETVHGRKLIYLDNAATAQVPAPVLEAVHRTESARGNIHRGVHALGDRSTRAFEKARETCAAFLGTDRSRVTFTAGTTDGINRAARSVRDKGVVVTAMEHHSNFVPWQQRCRATGKPFRVCPIRGDGTIDRAALDRLLDGDIGILAVTQMSNVLGMENPVAELCALAHERGIRVLVDGAQSACHLDIDVEAMGCDWFVCSGHKLGGPFGVGLLYSREPMPHTEFGGGMVDRVTEEETTFLPVWEAGTPPVSGAAGMAAAIEYRASLPAGWQEHEAALLRRAEARLREIPGLRILGAGPHIGCLSVAIEDVSAFDAAVLLDQMGIALRSGSHCAQPLHRALGLEYSLRISPAYYNTPEEIDALGDGLWQVVKMLRSRS